MLRILNIELLLDGVEHAFLFLNSVPPSHQEICHEVKHKFVEASQYIIVEEDLANHSESPLVGFHLLNESLLELCLVLSFLELPQQAHCFAYNIEEYHH